MMMMMQVITIALFVAVIWLAVKGFKAIRGKFFKRGLKLLGLSFATFLLMGVAIGITQNTTQAKQEAAQQAAQAAKDKAEADAKAKEEAIKN